MKTLNRRTFIGYAALPLVAGCQSIPVEDRILIASQMAETAARIGASVFLGQNPDAANLQAFRIVVAALKVLVDRSSDSTLALQDALGQLPIGKLDGTTSSLIWSEGVQIWNLAAIVFNVKSPEAVRTITIAIYNGLKSVVDSYPVTKAVGATIKPALPATPIKPDKAFAKARIIKI